MPASSPKKKPRAVIQTYWASKYTTIREAAHETMGLEVRPRNNNQFVTDIPETSELSKSRALDSYNGKLAKRTQLYAQSGITF